MSDDIIHYTFEIATPLTFKYLIIIALGITLIMLVRKVFKGSKYKEGRFYHG